MQELPTHPHPRSLSFLVAGLGEHCSFGVMCMYVHRDVCQACSSSFAGYHVGFLQDLAMISMDACEKLTMFLFDLLFLPCMLSLTGSQRT